MSSDSTKTRVGLHHCKANRKKNKRKCRANKSTLLAQCETISLAHKLRSARRQLELWGLFFRSSRLLAGAAAILAAIGELRGECERERTGRGTGERREGVAHCFNFEQRNAQSHKRFLRFCVTSRFSATTLSQVRVTCTATSIITGAQSLPMRVCLRLLRS